MMTRAFVPDDFDAPDAFDGPGFRMEPLTSRHNERDHDAWMSSIEHIRDTPGFDAVDWPKPMTLQANLSDLEGHARDFDSHTGFTYSILDDDVVIGCLYVYPSKSSEHDASVKSWVRESRSEMDVIVWKAVSEWLSREWPFENSEYDSRLE